VEHDERVATLGGEGQEAIEDLLLERETTADRRRLIAEEDADPHYPRARRIASAT
jgi:hypothetical protein